MSTPPLSFEDQRALALDPAAAAEARIAAAKFLAGEGLFAEMAAVADALQPATAEAQRLAMACRQFERWGLHDRLEPWADPVTGHRARAERTRSAMLLRRGASREAVIVFVGMASQFWVTLYMLERFLPADRHILFLKDPDRLSFACGCPAVGPGHADIGAALNRFLSQMSIDRFHVMGTSSGGFAALHFALTSGAAGALALSPETTLAPLAELALGAFGPDRATELAPRLPAPLDLVDLLGRPQYVPRPVLLIHAAGHAADARASARLSGLPGVEVEAIPDCAEHDILGPLIATGALRGVLGRGLDAG